MGSPAKQNGARLRLEGSPKKENEFSQICEKFVQKGRAFYGFAARLLYMTTER
jgi:hypothetical protein